MKNQITVSKKDLIRKSKAKHSADLHIALQLYAFYKAETIKMEPRVTYTCANASLILIALFKITRYFRQRFNENIRK